MFHSDSTPRNLTRNKKAKETKKAKKSQKETVENKIKRWALHFFERNNSSSRRSSTLRRRGPEVDELACRVGGGGEGKEPVEVMRACVNKVRAHYGVGGAASGRSMSAAAGKVGGLHAGYTTGKQTEAAEEKTPGLSRAALVDYCENGV